MQVASCNNSTTAASAALQEALGCIETQLKPHYGTLQGSTGVGLLSAYTRLVCLPLHTMAA